MTADLSRSSRESPWACEASLQFTFKVDALHGMARERLTLVEDGWIPREMPVVEVAIWHTRDFKIHN